MIWQPHIIQGYLVLQKEKLKRSEPRSTRCLNFCREKMGKSLEQFHSVLSSLAARGNFGLLETRLLRYIFIVNMTKCEAQNELCRSSKTPKEVYRITLSYERGGADVCFNIWGPTASGQTAGGLKIKTEPVGTIGGGYRKTRGRAHGSVQGRGQFRGITIIGDRRCYNYDKPEVTREFMNQCETKGVTCIFCRYNSTTGGR